MSTNLFNSDSLAEFVYLKYDENERLTVTVPVELSKIATRTQEGKFGLQTHMVLPEGLLKIDSIRLRRSLMLCVESQRSKSGKIAFPLSLTITRTGSGFKTNYSAEITQE